MLTLRFENHCIPLETCLLPADGRAAVGAAGTLVVVWARGGRCAVTAGGQTLAAVCGELAAAAGPAELAPAGGEALAVALGGAAAAEAAETLAGPQLFSGSRAGAAELVTRLAEGGAKLAANEASTLAYTLLCRLAGSGGAGRPSPLVTAAVAEIREHHASVYGVEELATALEVSKHHLIRRFSAEMGVPPGRYLTAVRVDAAKRLLLREAYSLDIIAGQCGFSGANYLCKVFKKETGETPAAWRKRALNAARPAPADPGPAMALEEQIFL